MIYKKSFKQVSILLKLFTGGWFDDQKPLHRLCVGR